MRFAAWVLVAFTCSRTSASDPGQPLDCSDWVFSVPGDTCLAMNMCVDPAPDEGRCFEMNDIQLDAESRLLQVGRFLTGGMCGRQPLHRLEVFIDSGIHTTLAHLDERCVDEGLDKVDGASWNGVLNPFARRLNAAWKGGSLASLESFSSGSSKPDYNSTFSSYVIIGFPSTFDVVQTFAPQLGFTVPYISDGVDGPSSFFSFWGSLSKPIDFTQAHMLSCHYPATPPHVGDYLTVPDTVPTPAPGEGVYYITGAAYWGAMRYGSKTIAGHLSRRDPALLPACTP